MKRVKKTGLKTFNNFSFIVSVMSVIVAVFLSFSAILLSQRQNANLGGSLVYAQSVKGTSFKDKTTYQLTPTQNNFTLKQYTLTDLVDATTLQNTGFNPDGTAIDTTTNNLTTMDYVWLPSYEGVEIDSSNVSTAGDPTGINTMIYNLTGVRSSNANLIATPTDFMVANRAGISYDNHSKYNTTQGTTHHWLRSPYSAGGAQYIHAQGWKYSFNPAYEYEYFLARPAMKLNLNAVISAQSQLGIVIGLDTSMGENAHTITIPNIMYPQTKVPAGSTLEQELDSAGGITARTSSTVTPSETLTKTGVTYRGYNASWQEYKYKNNYYVYAKVNKQNATYKFSDEFANGATVLNNTNYVWFKVEPIVWYITNWNSLPKSFTGETTEIATPDQQLVLLSQYVIVSVGKYYPNRSDDYCTMWQNSRFRAYLNGYNLAEQNNGTNGNASYASASQASFKGTGFVNTIWHDLKPSLISNATLTNNGEYKDGSGNWQWITDTAPDETNNLNSLTTTDGIWLPNYEGREINSSNVATYGDPTGLNTMIYNLTDVQSSNDNRKTTATDFALANNTIIWYSGPTNSPSYILRSPFAAIHRCVNIVNEAGKISYDDVARRYNSLRPALQLNLNSIISAQSQLGISIATDTPIGTSTKTTHTITIPNIMYPQTKVPAGSALEKSLNAAGGITSNTQSTVTPSNGLTATGVRYKTFTSETTKVYDYANEYFYNGAYYARCRVYRCRYYNNEWYTLPFSDESSTAISDGTAVANDTYVWFKVEPIVWYITNWNSLPSTFTGEATGGTDNTIICLSKYAIASIGQHYSNSKNDYCTLWQNSRTRAYLNGYNLFEQNAIMGNGNINYLATNATTGAVSDNNFTSFKGEGFIDTLWHETSISFLTPTTLQNTGFESDGTAIDTTTNNLTTMDYVWLPSYEDVDIDSSNVSTAGDPTGLNTMIYNLTGVKSNANRFATPTDFMVANLDNINYDYHSKYNTTQGSSFYWLRSPYSAGQAQYIHGIGNRHADTLSVSWFAARPAMKLNLNAVISAQSQLGILIGLDTSMGENAHTITIPNIMYPQTKVPAGSTLEQELDSAGGITARTSSTVTPSETLIKTGVTYRGYNASWQEYKYKNNYYVYAKVNKRATTNKFSDEFANGATVLDNTNYVWFKVEPIVWYITNWNSLPKSFTGENTEIATPDQQLVLLSQYAIVNVGAYYPNNSDDYRTMWQNSRLRAYLNGYDLSQQNTYLNGNPSYNGAQISNATHYPFANNGFLQTIWHDLQENSLVDILNKTTIDNAVYTSQTEYTNVQTSDYVYLPTAEELQNYNSTSAGRIATPTDWALANRANLNANKHSSYNTSQGSTYYWLRSSTSNTILNYVDYSGNINSSTPMHSHNASLLALNISLSNLLNTNIAYTVNKQNKTITFPNILYPQTKVSGTLETNLNSAYSSPTATNNLAKTGRFYAGITTWNEGTPTTTYCEEYFYQGEYYVRTLVQKYNSSYAFSDRTTTANGSYIWVKCEPIVWCITNWDKMPSNINPDSSLTMESSTVASSISCLSQYALVSVGHYYPNLTDNFNTAWQNSVIRAYLNGYNIAEELASSNGSTTYASTILPTFKGFGFVDVIWHGYIVS